MNKSGQIVKRTGLMSEKRQTYASKGKTGANTLKIPKKKHPQNAIKTK
jgi:hypothetical protein